MTIQNRHNLDGITVNRPLFAINLRFVATNFRDQASCTHVLYGRVCSDNYSRRRDVKTLRTRIKVVFQYSSIQEIHNVERERNMFQLSV